MSKNAEYLSDDHFRYQDSTCALGAFHAVEEEFGRKHALVLWRHWLALDREGVEDIYMSNTFTELAR